jgi:hypothetical protein
MSTTTINLTPRLRLAANALREHGWTTGVERDNAGKMCLTGAVKYCAPRNGDEYIIREVLRKRDRAERWNDADATEAEVIAYLDTAEITDAALYVTFGPQALEIVALIRRMYELTAGQWDALAAASQAASWTASWVASRDASWTASLAASRDASRAASRDASWTASWTASWALSLRDLIGKHGFTQEHYDTLTGPWRKVVGKLHPDDPDIFEVTHESVEETP